MDPQGTPSNNLLIVDDESDILDVCSRVAQGLGFSCMTARSAEEAAELMAGLKFEIVLTDVRMPGGGGFDVLEHVQAHSPDTAVVMMSAYGTIDQAVSAMKRGVVDYLPKPFDTDRLSELLTQVAAWRGCRGMGRGAVPSERGAAALRAIVGRCAVMQDVIDRIKRAATVDSTVLIQGESGTGKELVARAVHECSAQGQGPFIAVDCGGISESLVASELFGHLKGAFTGADTGTPGVLRAAEGGTVFLDEIGDLPASVQAAVLRALQEREVRPVGGVRPASFDARVIAATNRDLEQEVVTGAFRRDLFYRLQVIPIHVPPLRERRQDLPLLVEAQLARCAGDTGRPAEITPEAMDVLMSHDWPGNVRELMNWIEQACVMGSGDQITLSDLPLAVPRGAPHAREPGSASGEIRTLAAYEEQAIRDALRRTAGNKRGAARALDISAPTLYAKIKKYGIGAP